jgi:hypothetical protein
MRSAIATGSPVPISPAYSTGPDKESNDAAGRSDAITVIEVVTARIVKVHRFLNEPQTEHPAIEIHISLGVSGNRRDVVNTPKWFHELWYLVQIRCRER